MTDDVTDRPGVFRSPWLDQLTFTAPQPLTRDMETDVAIVGAGIAGLATAFFVLRDTMARVVLLERSRAGTGASGRNAGQLVTYFERPLCDLVDSFGFDLATRAQAEVETGWTLLDQMVAAAKLDVPVERFFGAMGMFSLNHLMVHLRNVEIRKQAGLDEEFVEIADTAPFLDQIPERFSGLYDVVPQARIRQQLAVETDRYVAILRNRKGCANSALLCQELLAFLRAAYAERFVYADHTEVSRVILDQREVELRTAAHRVRAQQVVLCTNGFSHHIIENRSGSAVGLRLQSKMRPRIGYMVAFTAPAGAPADAVSYINNAEIGGKKPYFYVTRRPYAGQQGPVTLTCLGGPEALLMDGTPYAPDDDVPPQMLDLFDGDVRDLVAPERPKGQRFDYAWHGLMAYTDTRVRLVGRERDNPALLYNLGCNGVGFLPSIAGGRRIARLVAGETLTPSLFDP